MLSYNIQQWLIKLHSLAIVVSEADLGSRDNEINIGNIYDCRNFQPCVYVYGHVLSPMTLKQDNEKSRSDHQTN